jgi:hypothetical protein
MRAAPVIAVALFLSACASVKPVPVRSGDVCFHCRQTITDISLAAEVISPQGHAFKFSSVSCLTEYLREHPEEAVRAIFVTDHARGKMLRAQQAWFVKFPVDPKLKRLDYAAFREKDTAASFAETHDSTLAEWETALNDTIAHAGH